MYVLRMRFAKVEEGKVGSLEAEIEARREFAGEGPVLQEAMRVRLCNCTVVEIHGLGDVAIKAGKFGSDQELHMPISGRSVPGPRFKARETISYLLDVAFARRAVRVSGGSRVCKGRVKMKGRFQKHAGAGQRIGLGGCRLGGGGLALSEPVSERKLTRRVNQQPDLILVSAKPLHDLFCFRPGHARPVAPVDRRLQQLAYRGSEHAEVTCHVRVEAL